MTEELQPAAWDDMLKSSDFIALEEDKEKVITLKLPPMMRENDRFNKKQLELVMDCIEEDGEACEKQFTCTSKRLLKKLRPVIEEATKAGKNTVKVSILRVGEKFNTQYSVKEV